MIISTNNSTTFNAKLNVSRVVQNKQHWEKVAKSFERKTKNDSLNSIIVQDNLAVKFNGCVRFTCSLIDKSGQQAGVAISCDAETLAKLNNEKPAKVADKLVKLYQMGKTMAQKDIKAGNKVFDLFNKYENVCPSFESLLDTFYYPHKKIINADAAKKLENTPELSCFKITV